MKSKYVWIVVIIIAAVALAYVLMKKPAKAPVESATPAPQQNTQTQTPTASGNEQKQSSSTEANRLIGSWRSKDDANFTREFRADGTVTDSYDGSSDATEQGTWTQVINPDDEPYRLPAVGNTTIIKVEFGKTVYYFAVAKTSTTDSLELIHLNGKGNLKFTKVN